MALKVLIPQDITAPGKDFLRKKGYTVEVTHRFDLESLCRDAADADGILARLCPYPKEVFAAAPKLRVIARHGSGYNNVDVDAATRAGVLVCITPTAPVNAVAEHTMALLLACARQLPVQDSLVRKGEWNCRSTLNFCELKGKTLGLIGFGSIGQLVAKKAHYGFEMKVLAYSRHAPSEPLDYAVHTTDLDAVLAQADVISLHLPSTEKTRGMFDQTTFSKMKPGVIFLNTARGDLVDESALYEALFEKKIFMAGLDVLADESHSERNVLTTLENVILTPHSAAMTVEAKDQMGLLAAMEIDRVLSGQAPKWPVNFL